MGAFLAEMPKATGGQPYQSKPTGAAREPVESPTLREIGITKKESSRARFRRTLPTAQDPIFTHLGKLTRDPRVMANTANAHQKHTQPERVLSLNSLARRLPLAKRTLRARIRSGTIAPDFVLDNGWLLWRAERLATIRKQLNRSR